jgi:hypothetical protein
MIVRDSVTGTVMPASSCQLMRHGWRRERRNKKSNRFDGVFDVPEPATTCFL